MELGKILVHGARGAVDVAVCAALDDGAADLAGHSGISIVPIV